MASLAADGGREAAPLILMLLSEVKKRVADVELQIAQHPFVVFHVFERDGRRTHVALTNRLRRIAQKGHVWQSKEFLTALKNAGYGFDPNLQRSVGGRDGIFLLTRDYHAPNEMMRKIFDHYLDQPDKGVEEVAESLGVAVSDLKAVRVVSHHLRLLGVLWQREEEDWLVLVDYDQTK